MSCALFSGAKLSKLMFLVHTHTQKKKVLKRKREIKKGFKKKKRNKKRNIDVPVLIS